MKHYSYSGNRTENIIKNSLVVKKSLGKILKKEWLINMSWENILKYKNWHEPINEILSTGEKYTLEKIMTELKDYSISGRQWPTRNEIRQWLAKRDNINSAVYNLEGVEKKEANYSKQYFRYYWEEL